MTNWKEDLTKAVYRNDFSAVQAILALPQVQREISTVTQWKPDEDPLHWAAIPGHSELLELLIKAGCQVDAEWVGKSGQRFTALHSVVFYNHLVCAEILLRNGADPEKKSQNWPSKIFFP